MTAYEQTLRARVARWPAHACWRELTADVLRQVAVSHGSDFATALLHDRLVRSAEHGPFIRRVDRCAAAEPVRPGALLAIVPGACYREYPHTGADGRRLREDAQRHGWSVEVIPVASFGSLAANAATIVAWLRDRPEPTIALVSVSKGSADVRTALARPDASAALRKVAVWISLSGIIHGTALTSWFLDRAFWRTVARLLCWRHGYAFSTLEEIARRRGGPLDCELTLPAGLRVVHVVGLPLACHLRTRPARRGHRRVAAHGPNDGGGFLLGDLCRLPGWIYPVLGADHYLAPDADLGPIIRRILHVALEPGPTHAPAGTPARKEFP